MKIKSPRIGVTPRHAKTKPTPRVAPARRIDPERSQRMWSLLLPPTFPPERK